MAADVVVGMVMVMSVVVGIVQDGAMLMGMAVVVVAVEQTVETGLLACLVA